MARICQCGHAASAELLEVGRLTPHNTAGSGKANQYFLRGFNRSRHRFHQYMTKCVTCAPTVTAGLSRHTD